MLWKGIAQINIIQDTLPATIHLVEQANIRDELVTRLVEYQLLELAYGQPVGDTGGQRHDGHADGQKSQDEFGGNGTGEFHVNSL